MIADELFSAHARPWLIDNYRGLTRTLAPLPCLGLAWWLSAATLPAPVWLGVIGYALAHLTLIGLLRADRTHSRLLAQGAVGSLRILLDVLLAFLLVRHAAWMGDAIYPLYTLLGLRVFSTYQQTPLAAIIPFLFGPAYLFAYHLANEYLRAASLGQMAQWSLLIASLAFGVIAIWSSVARQRENDLLRHDLRNERLAREARVGELERTTNDIRSRMRELHALEEGLRVITSTLSLDEVLNQIVDSTVQMLGPARVQGMALSLLEGDIFEHRSCLPEGDTDCSWAAPLARQAMRQATPLIISDAALHADSAGHAGGRDLDGLMPHGLRAALCVPLFIGEGAARGALTVVSRSPSAFSSSDARHLTALGIQAGIAIHNAEMHSRLHRQQRLLEAVVRDINDGLVVVDARGQIVLANPIGRELLDGATAAMPVQDELLSLAASMRAENMPMLIYELRTAGADLDSEHVYQAFASQVHQDDHQEPLIAIVLHDITAQKIEERTRTEFFSMVSHELRNPLNSLNGFIKIVLQGRAGALTPLQHEFLEIADGQVEQLKGRIAELLEFNRLDAGRLSLDPQWNDLPFLVAGTVTRLRLQAEHAGLELLNEVDDDLPECYFDSERIGQVLTNLIENAIKATPPGGSITVRSELHESEMWMRICDTGVGIPADEQSKVFQRFYRVHNRTSSQGNHLGLGLAICQQIVEGHKGRIWVESEEGRGSCFSFALPLIAREIGING
jgi:two-component system, NtrC family, sensor histidine kinase KinB